MGSLKDGFTDWRQSQKEDFLSMICLVMAQIHFSLIKKIKIERPEHSLTPHLPPSDNISFLP